MFSNTVVRYCTDANWQGCLDIVTMQQSTNEIIVTLSQGWYKVVRDQQPCNNLGILFFQMQLMTRTCVCVLWDVSDDPMFDSAWSKFKFLARDFP